MPPFPLDQAVQSEGVSMEKRNDVGRPTDPDGLLLEGWAQGFLVGSLVVMSCITIANMRKGVLLHKLILLELLLGIPHGFWILFHPPIYTWWLSVSAILLNASWSLHNVIAWMKIKPFLPRWASLIFIITVVLAQPYWIVEIFANFQYFHGWGNIFLRTRPWEPLCRDPWWIFTTVALFWNIVARYELSAWDVLRISPRFVLMLSAMVVSVVFIVPDVLSVTGVLDDKMPTGINPFFKLSFVFKCLTDSVVLDDFKTALDRLRALKLGQMGSLTMDHSICEARFRDREEQRRTSRWSFGRSLAGEGLDGRRMSKMTNMHMESLQPTESGEPSSTDRGTASCGRESPVSEEIQEYNERIQRQQSPDTGYAEAIREVQRADRSSRGCFQDLMART
ncbi:hypothetical protein EJ05DRAFT_540941 [Pseudovirgaria hyperparasitica]|uniref:Uncharacterized protein n=1 Tax=Pseudovirgaria hyperparasitica TaxID=470096 RepID=A0A6A6VYG1_9PEZI|nr:uncharacterized protein EJ05DRAFT_540941 [Pseudovirgaria hyperparasitica]KAF2754899.1 hypothetical protein EJ05DRAFT_540941 [Pseudovirgaria hyperparasitica]